MGKIKKKIQGQIQKEKKNLRRKKKSDLDPQGKNEKNNFKGKNERKNENLRAKIEGKNILGTISQKIKIQREKKLIVKKKIYYIN